MRFQINILWEIVLNKRPNLAFRIVQLLRNNIMIFFSFKNYDLIKTELSKTCQVSLCSSNYLFLTGSISISATFSCQLFKLLIFSC